MCPDPNFLRARKSFPALLTWFPSQCPCHSPGGNIVLFREEAKAWQGLAGSPQLRSYNLVRTAVPTTATQLSCVVT
jgi:hypothetical protein